MALEPVSRLRLLQGRGSEARRHAIGEAPLSIGRDRGNDVVLCDRAASARHCRIEPTGGRLHVRDLGSRNGTQINGVRVDRAELVAGDVLRVGRSDLLLVEQAPAVADRRSLVAESPASLSLLAEARRYAELPWPALVLGESGSGKEGIAELLHSAGPRAGGPLVALNAGGVPTELVESELFGHEKGAFTGAAAMRRGVFEQADGGTLFLDEIGELPLSLQARLLRVLETGEVRRVGAESAREVDVRLVCATHRDLRAMVGRGEFRQDLFFRIARIVLEVAPLRERRADIDALADHFLRELSGVLGPRSLGEGARNRLRAYRWPGNVRELRNVLSAAAASSTARVLEQEDVDRALLQVGAGDPQAQTLDHMRRVLEQHGGNLTAAARALGIPRTTLRDRVRHYRARP
jgi:DNA-binding NtrC family response regulator